MIDTPFWVGDVVHHRMADDDCPGLVIRVQFSDQHQIYCVSWRGRSESWHSAFELQVEKPTAWIADTKTGDGEKA